MLHKKRYKKVIAIVLMIVMMFSITNSAYAEINNSYYDINIAGLEVVDSALNEKVSGSGLLNAIGLLIYSIGSLMEWVLGSIYEMIAGQAIFPWADAIVFNAIPLLDVNFISPTQVGGGSFLYIIRDTLQDVYATIFGVAISFFSISVMVMAIKLVMSTISSEKAKYKQAVGKWAIGLLLLCVIHYGMSFIFYLNEQLVTLASDIATENISNVNEKMKQLTDSSEYNKNLIRNFIDLNNTEHVNWWEGLVAAVVALVLIIAVVVLTVGTARYWNFDSCRCGCSGISCDTNLYGCK